jgi:hypothetical protein
MRVVLHTVTLRMIRLGGLCVGVAGLVPFALGQTNLDADALPTDNLHSLSPLSEVLRLVLWFLGATLLVIAAVLTTLRYRVSTSVYETPSDERWDEDAREDVGEDADADEVDEAIADLEGSGPSHEAAVLAVKAAPPQQARIFVPASGPAWRESMLRAFLGTCMKVNCLGRTWSESASWRMASSNQPDPREAELIRRLMQRWPEFHVDPETGVFVEHASAAGRSRVCIVSVIKDKRTLTEVGLNAGFVIESVGRYFKNTDLVYRRGLGHYHAPTKAELATMTPGEKESLIRITDIPDPWQVMITGTRPRV